MGMQAATAMATTGVGAGTGATAAYLRQYRARAGGLPGRGVKWLEAERAAGLARFAEVGFPSERDEDWRYTGVKPILGKEFYGWNVGDLAEREVGGLDLDGAGLGVGGLDSHRLVFVDGVFVGGAEGLGEEGVRVAPLAEVLEGEEEAGRIEAALGGSFAGWREGQHGFRALNHAYSETGAVVLVEGGTRVGKVVEMVFVSRAGNGCAQPRNLVIAGEGSGVVVVERYVSVDDGEVTFTNSGSEVVVGEGAEVDYYLVQMQGKAAYQVCGVWAELAGGSRFSCRTITLGGALVRNDLAVALGGVGAHCDMFGLYQLEGAQHVDNHTTVEHRAEGCSSRECYKGVLGGRSRAVFHGRIQVQEGAQKTDAVQNNAHLLLSANAEVDTKPQLEIYADDVKCAHGATVGQLNADALFYLRARGIAEGEAMEMLRLAFLGEVLEEVAVEGVREAVEGRLAEMGGGGK